MTRLFFIHEAAEAEINEAADFYDLESSGLGLVFIDEIQRVIERIAEFPEASPLIRGRDFQKTILHILLNTDG